MNIVIRNTGDTPIYEQIVRQVKSAIMAGELQEGEALPSMRAAGQRAAHQPDHHQARL